MKTKRGKRRVRKSRSRKIRFLKWPSPSFTTLRTRVEAWHPIISVGAGDLAYSYPLNLPGNYRNAANTFGAMPHVPANFAGLLAIFDTYRVIRLKVMLISNAADDTITTVDLPNIVYMGRDLDDSLHTSEAGCLNNGIMPKRIQDGTKKICVFTQVPQMRKRYVNTSVSALLPTAAPASNQAAIPENFYSSIKFFLPAVGATTSYGRAYASWDVEFKGLRNV